MDAYRIRELLIGAGLSYLAFPSTSTTYYPCGAVDASQADKVTIYVSSSLNQAVTIQLLGNSEDAGRSSGQWLTVGASQSIGVGSTAMTKLALTVNLQDFWHRFFSVSVATGGTAPTAGNLTVMAVVRELVAQDMQEIVAEALKAKAGVFR